uniref:Uncharacterized protein n=1 Tax=uncultured marine virus TaxID=186617 RepID=A0A0F7LAJ4_9VIRU|nr:hypothetical protein [uncultured marine virus]
MPARAERDAALLALGLLWERGGGRLVLRDDGTTVSRQALEGELIREARVACYRAAQAGEGLLSPEPLREPETEPEPEPEPKRGDDERPTPTEDDPA